MSVSNKHGASGRAPQAISSLEVLPELEEATLLNGAHTPNLHVDRKFQGKESILSSQISLFVEENKPNIPDGGWGWLVVLAAFVINAVSEGIIFTFGLLYIEFLHEFGASKSATSWIGSLFMAIPLLSGPIASAFVDRYGCKSMTVLGALICVVGFVISSYVRSMALMYVTFGVIGGIGRGLSYVTAVVSIAFWFEKKRAFVLGLAASGAGFGTIVFAPLSTWLLFEYGWRGTLLIFAGLFANMCVCGVLMRNPDWIIEEERRQNKEKEQKKNDANMKILKKVLDSKEAQHLLPNSSNTERGNHRIMSEVSLPTYLKQHEKVPVEVLKQLSTNKELYKVIVDNYPSLANCKSDSNEVHSSEHKDLHLVRRNSKTRKSHHHSHSYLRNIRFRKNSMVCRSAMLHIHKYKIKASSCPNVYRNSVTIDDDEEEEKWYKEYIDILKDLTNFSLFLELHFFLLALSTIILYIWFIVPYFYLAEHMNRSGYSESQASLVLSIIGLTNTVGMIVLGWVGDKLNVAKTYAICLILTGISVGAMMFFTDSFILLVTSSGFFGLFFASCFSLTPSLLAELVSLDDFTMAYGLILLCDGIGNLTGPPLAGLLFDLTGSWAQSFYQAAFWIIISGILVGIIPYTKNRKLGGGELLQNKTDNKNNKETKRRIIVH